MASGEPSSPAGGPEDALRGLEERLDRASAAAERLMAEACAAGAGSREPPPSGWQMPEGETASRGDGDLDALVALLRSLRELIPPDLQQRLVEAMREVLQAIRALLDWYLERLERPRAQPREVQDIPIL
jgi:hypothetical protein